MKCMHYSSSPVTVNFLRCLLSWRVMTTMTMQSMTRIRMMRIAAPPTAPPTIAALIIFMVGIQHVPESVCCKEDH